jgi:NAD(P)H dehydrogenase (quinone)
MITVTGATGQLGRLVLEGLLARVPATELSVVVRDPAKAAELAARGVTVRQADYTKPETLSRALAGTDKLLLISASEIGQRLAQHGNVIAAAKQAGVKLLVYTSMLSADTSGIGLAPEHKGTEGMIRASGIPFVILRNGWYMENYSVPMALQHGALIGSAGEGRIAAATRADYAAAAVAVLTGAGHEGKTYELTGDAGFTMKELAGEISRQSGKPVVYQDLPVEQYKGALLGFGLPEPAAALFADADLGVARGELDVKGDDLRRLIGRPTTRLTDAVAAALKA